MYKLTIVSGPNRGATYGVGEGESTIGRQAGSEVQLQSSKVSKRHCKLVVFDGKLLVEDQGSANGTYVNGSLVRSRQLKPGDRISVGDFVLEVSAPVQPRGTRIQALPEIGGAARFSARGVGGTGQQPSLYGGGFPAVSGSSALSIDPQAMAQPSQPDEAFAPGAAPKGPPQDIVGKALFYFEEHVMPQFYGINLKYEWRSVMLGIFGVFLVANLAVSVYPLVSSSRALVIKETKKRARFMARQIADRNTPYLAQKMETKTEIGTLDSESAGGAGRDEFDVRLAVLTDLDNRILAPSAKMNQYLTSGREATFAVEMAERFRAGREIGGVREVDGSTVVAVEPVRVVSGIAGKNVAVAMAIVSIDSSLVAADFGSLGIIYSETLILTGILGGVILLILYRLTLKPFEILGDDLNRALKGDLAEVTHEYKMLETNPLWDLINSALQRLPKSSAADEEERNAGITAEDFAGPVRAIAGAGSLALVLCDAERRVVYLSEVFQELSGIRGEGASGQDFSSVARDEALGALINDLFDRAPVGGDPLTEDFEFSGVKYQVQGSAIGNMGAARGYLLVATRQAET